MTRASPRGLRYAIGFAFAVAFSLLYLNASTHVGRLALDLQYDDVGYALDAATRVDVAINEGMQSALRLFRDIPPHSFLSTLQGMAAFAILGVSDYALYASNAWLLILMSMLVVHALRARTATTVALVLAFLLTAPLCYFAISEFRPDLPLGFATALMAWLLLDAGFRDDPRMAKWAGASMAAALVIKPTFFAHTLAIAIGLAIAGAVATRLQGRSWMPRFVLRPRSIAIFFAIGFAAALPAFLVNGKEAVEYFWTNTAGARGEVWNYSTTLGLGDMFEKSVKLVTLLGRTHTPAAIIAALAMSVLLWRRRERAAAAQVAALLAVAAVSATIIFLGRQPSHFFFATMHWLVLFAAGLAYVRYADGSGRRARAALAVAATLLIAGLVVRDSRYTVPDAWPEAHHGNSWNERIVELVRRDLRGDGSNALPPTHLLALTASSVNPHTLIWVGRQKGLSIDASEIHLLADMDEAHRLAGLVDYVVVPNVALAPYDGWLPVSKVQVPMLEWLLADARFEPLNAIGSTTKYYVFANRANTSRFRMAPVVILDGAPLETTGLRGEEGPYPALSPPLPRIRWIEGQSARICAYYPAARSMTLEVGFHARTAGSLSVAQGGKTLARKPLVPGSMESLTIGFPGAAGKSCFDLLIQAEPTQPPLHVALTRFSVTAAKEARE